MKNFSIDQQGGNLTADTHLEDMIVDSPPPPPPPSLSTQQDWSRSKIDFYFCTYTHG